MRKTIQRSLLGAALLIAFSTGAVAAELGVLAPVIQDKSVLMRAAPGSATPAPVVTRVREGRLYESLQRESAQGATAAVLALDELAMRIAGLPVTTTWLYLSQEDGGFARHGFWLREGDAMRWVDEAMVDLVVDADSVADGSFEEIFAHELGHVMLRRLMPNLPAGYSRTPHHSFSVTDQQTAFDEGWATHFQALARLLTQNGRLRAQDAGLEGKADTASWLSNLDRAMRIDGMRRNWFVFRQLPRPGSDPRTAVERHDLSPLFDRAELKSAAQMLACEGAVATFFYRQLGTSDSGALTRRYAAMFRALHALSKEPLDAETPLVPALARTMASVEPEDGKRFIATLAEASHGALLAPGLATAAQATFEPALAGDADVFVPQLKPLRARFAQALAEAQAQPDRLARHAGPAIWLLAPAHRGQGQDAPPLAVDLNTAERAHLLALGLDGKTAERALASRRKDGDFASLADFTARAGLLPAAARRLAAQQDALRRLGPYRRS
jgi:hypothetical protein